MKSVKKSMLFAGAALLAIAVVATVSCAKKQNEQGEAQRQKVHLEVGHLSATGHTKYFIAKEAG
ncbi:MAG: hypothetical protein LBP68_03960, partial [Acidobacteriota bacterium]|nr:hypothetical protein [Acidobacteriota bacterium]